MKTIVFTHPALKQFEALPPSARTEVRVSLRRYVIEAHGDVTRLKGSDLFRLRVGRYRVIFAEDLSTVLAVYVGKRETTTYRKGRT